MFSSFLLLALALLSSFFANYWLTRSAIARQCEQLLIASKLGVLADTALSSAADAVKSGIAFTGTSIWTVLLIAYVIGMDLPGRMVIPFIFIWVVGEVCTAGISTFNRMMNMEIRDEIVLRTLSMANELKPNQPAPLTPPP